MLDHLNITVNNLEKHELIFKTAISVRRQNNFKMNYE
ncbi:MAG: hypothetical protein UT48_C0007G0011 [Parcubacteria group bacterium GW2011_GWE2_39_37]|uniref:Uncharacterized protein n=1 Tax=Candidatus Falkowbacteria bacterium GW2011_GWF2_39_8 TaxID=1618642 RepID=A0A0G0SEJ1_9BACT|nr:MAG: hypothetical protein UT48_C0007G0011 [Parcubacteria group bacterium GW2011_GWE2_39_37]KKR33105.1 MAG: hypothetical protein UT64_C0015G0017 [Candidatus Falkowbacteria bacterium GW2011_GWF2_39_8]